MESTKARDWPATETPENNILLLAARGLADPEADAGLLLPPLLEGSVNWARLLWMAHRNSMLPAVYGLLRGVSDGSVPASIVEQLRTHYESNRRRNLALIDEAGDALGVLKDQGIDALCLRMPALLTRFYDDAGIREYEPLDVLVGKRDIGRSQAVLLESGYRKVFELTPAREAALRRSRSFLPLHNDALNIRFHLHDRVMPEFYRLRGEDRTMWLATQTQVREGRQLALPSQESLLLLLCAHGTLHLWGRLVWIVDVARAMALMPDDGWDALVARAENAGAGRILRLGLLLAHDLLGARLPERLRSELMEDEPILDQVRQVEARFARDANSRISETQRMRIRLQMREGRADRIRFILNFVLTPTVEDWKRIILPDLLFPLYSLIRPLRLAAEVVKARLGRAENAPYFSTPMPLVERMLEMAEITPDDVVYELGCGDGRMVINAAKRYGARGFGVDLDAQLVAESRANARAAGVETLVTFAVEDVMNVDLQPATVILVWLLPGQQLQLRRKMERELRQGARIVAHSFDIGDWVPVKVEVVEVAAWGQESQIAYLWRVGETSIAAAAS